MTKEMDSNNKEENKTSNIINEYLLADEEQHEQKVLKKLIKIFDNKPVSIFMNEFWLKKNISESKKEKFIRGLFLYLLEVSSEKKLEILNKLKLLYAEGTEEIKELTRNIFYAALFEKKNYKIALMAMDFYFQIYANLSEAEKDLTFHKLRDFIEYSGDFLADEGVNSFGSILHLLDERKLQSLVELLISKMKTKDQDLLCSIFDLFSQILKKELVVEDSGDEGSSQFFIADSKAEKYYEQLKIFLNKNKDMKRLKTSDAIFCYLDLIVSLSNLFTQYDFKLSLKLLKKAVSNLTEINQKRFLRINLILLKSKGFSDVSGLLSIIQGDILKIYRSKSVNEPYLNDLLEEIMLLIWDFLPEPVKEEFYQ